MRQTWPQLVLWEVFAADRWLFLQRHSNYCKTSVVPVNVAERHALIVTLAFTSKHRHLRNSAERITLKHSHLKAVPSEAEGVVLRKCKPEPSKTRRIEVDSMYLKDTHHGEPPVWQQR